MESPCINQCCLDENDVCVGCFRHINEICGWSEASEARQQEIILNCQQRKQRRAELNQPFPPKQDKV